MRPQTISRRTLLLGVFGVAAIVAVVVVLALRNEPPPDVARGGEPLPVVLVHGYGGNAASMSAIQARLQRAGRQVTSIDLPNGGTGDIVQSARVVVDTVQATGSPKVDLIGFSMGGVVVRTYLDEFGGSARARYVITLASPNHGTSVAGLAAIADPGLCTGACAQLAPDSSFLEELNEPDETPEGPAFVALWTERDETVRPPESGELDGALNIRIQDVCPSSQIGHGDMARDPVVLGLIVATLTGELSAPPADDSCAELATLGL